MGQYKPIWALKEAQKWPEIVVEIERGTLFFGLFWASMSESPGRPIWDPLGTPLGPILGHLGAILGPSWAILGPSWGHLGAILGPSWAHLGRSWDRLEPSWA